MKRTFFAMALAAGSLALGNASALVIDYQASGLFTPVNRDIPQTGFSFAFSAPETALNGVFSYSTPSTLTFSNGLSESFTLTFVPTVVRQVGQQAFALGNDFGFFRPFDNLAYGFFLPGPGITDGRRSEPGNLTDTNFVTGTQVGGPETMIIYHISSPFAVPGGTCFITTPVDSFSITGTVAPVPETSSMGLLALLTCAGAWLVLRRRVANTA